MDNFIQLKEDNILKIGIKKISGYKHEYQYDEKGNVMLDENGDEIIQRVPIYEETGEHLEFDLEDIELPIRLNQCNEEHKNNLRNFRNQILIIEKRQDKKGKKLLSWNEEEKLKVTKKFLEDEMKALDLFIGEGGTAKLLNGRKPYISMYDDISSILEPILPLIKERCVNIHDKIISKYKTKKDDVIE